MTSRLRLAAILEQWRAAARALFVARPVAGPADTGPDTRPSAHPALLFADGPVGGLPPQGLAGWLMRYFAQRRSAQVPRRMAVLETLALGPRRQLTLVECDGRRYLVGGGVDTIATIVPVEILAASVDGLAVARLAVDRLDLPVGRKVESFSLSRDALAGQDPDGAIIGFPRQAAVPFAAAAFAANPVAPPVPAEGLRQTDGESGPELLPNFFLNAAEGANGFRSPAQVAEEILQALRGMQVERSATVSSDLTKAERPRSGIGDLEAPSVPKRAASARRASIGREEKNARRGGAMPGDALPASNPKPSKSRSKRAAAASLSGGERPASAADESDKVALAARQRGSERAFIPGSIREWA